ncbi:IclR family transcriptional regulator, partial [Mesorhizobium sp. M8A.F.Ca.ET.059.01.1.1]
MKSVDRALYLLSYFTVQEPEWGLSDLARKSKVDKATTLRI